MRVARTLPIELGIAVLLLGCYSEAELCLDEGEACTAKDPVGCTQRAVCQSGSEISVGQEDSGCKQCQKPCSEKIYIQYSSPVDKTPATGWYTYHKEKNRFTRQIDNITFILHKKYENWTLIEFKKETYVDREITKRIKLSYKNDTRTRMSLENFEIYENERKSLNVFIAPKQGRKKRGTPYEEKLVIFCPGKCLCKKLHVNTFSSKYCFRGFYEREDENNDSEQTKYKSSTENSPIRKIEDNSDTAQSRTKRYVHGFEDSNQSPDQSDSPNSLTNNDQLQDSVKSITNTYPNTYSASSDDDQYNNDELDSSKYLPNTNANNDSAKKGEQSKEKIQNSEESILDTNPNAWFATNDEENQNWKQESYILTSESYDDDPFELTFDEDYHVWFIGRGDMIAGVSPEASPCPELIQKQSWYAISQDFKLELGGLFDKVNIVCKKRD